MKCLVKMMTLVGTLLLSSTMFGHSIYSIQFENYKEGMIQLNKMGADIAGIDYDKKIVDVSVLNIDAIANLKKTGIPFEILESKVLKSASALDEEYHNPEDVESKLKELVDGFPEIAKLTSIGQSVEGRDIWAVKISDNVEEHELGEPAILFNSMHHSRELMTTEVALDIVERLLTGYNSDDKSTHWIDSNEIWVVPQVNPDGNHKVWSGSEMWRKNVSGSFGVDLNRNYPYKWGACNGSSGFMFSDTYRGPSAGSEPETKTIMKLVSNIRPVFDISYHSYSELVLYPYSCEGEHTETANIVEGIGKKLAGLLESDDGRSTYEPGTSWEILYGVDGGDIDWMYNEYGVIPYVVELNSRSAGFHPSYSLVEPTLEKQAPGWGFLLDRLDGSSVRGVLDTKFVDSSTRLRIEGLGDNDYGHTHKVTPEGDFYVILDPGMYSVTLVGSDFDALTQEVTVGAEPLLVDFN